jgi:electron transport complex protein RnfG
MKQIIRITVGLTLSCLIAAFVMGATFMVTHEAKKHNEHMNVQQTMLGLLGYGKQNPVPSDLALHSIYRYIIEEGQNKFLGYVLPVEAEGEDGYMLVMIDLEGNFVSKYALSLGAAEAGEAPEREAALLEVLKPPKTFSYSDATVVAELGERRVAYLLPGAFPGFKTFIHVMLALNPNYEIRGLEIMEHEEDPGLGAEIEEDYFKNQFSGKPLEKVKELEVVKEPLPDRYRACLEGETGTLSASDIEQIRSQYRDQDIYALTGATISSRAVTVGVKGMIKKFAYRIEILDRVMDRQNIKAAF